MISGGMAAEFVHLHVHSQYSFLVSTVPLGALPERTEALGQGAIALTDNANMFGAIRHYTGCRSRGLQPILGCEINVRRSATTEETDHLVVLAGGNEGYQSLIGLVSTGHLSPASPESPSVTLDELGARSKGLIVLTGCMGGVVAQRILELGPEHGETVLGELRDRVDEGSLYVELQNHGLPEQPIVNEALVGAAKRLGLPLVATNDVHYLDADDGEAQVYLECVGSNSRYADVRKWHHGTFEMYLKSAEQMAAAFPDHPEALRNTLAIAERCSDLELTLGKPMLPRFPVPKEHSIDSYFRKVSEEGLETRFREFQHAGKSFNESAYRDRLALELKTITSMEYSGYFLIVWDFIREAKARGVPVGPGRGSGAGSLVAYSLDITAIDPLPYNLFFERFLNPERVSMPDFDIDFCKTGREEVIQYVTEKYGAECVGQIATFQNLKARSVIKDVARAMGISAVEAQQVANMVPSKGQGQMATITEALELEPKLKTLTEEDERIAELIRQARKLEGLTRHAGMHAAGVVISDGPLDEHVPCFAPDGSRVTQYDKDDVESAGLVKFDFLGLKTLTVIDIAQRLVNARPERKDNPIDVASLPLDDKPTYDLITSGDTTGVFQLESSGMQALLRKLKPDCFEDVVAAVALFRPGPLGTGMIDTFVDVKHGREEIRKLHPLVDPVLATTYGVPVYQEQVMQIAQRLSGYTLGGADVLRRVMGKKKLKEMEAQKKIFIDGAAKNGVAESKAEAIFNEIEGFASYGFNKSHSAAYAAITYQTAYLKQHYPTEFFAGLLTADKDKNDKVVRTLAEARAWGVQVLPPDINQSQLEFSVVYTHPRGDGPLSKKGRVRDRYGPQVRFGLGAVRGVGDAALECVFESREQGGEFGDLFDFSARADARRLNRGVLEALVQCGALDSTLLPIGISRARAFESIDRALERCRSSTRDREAGQTSLFGAFDAAVETATTGAAKLSDYKTAADWEWEELLAREKSALGWYVSGHPLDRYADRLAPVGVVTTGALDEVLERESGGGGTREDGSRWSSWVPAKMAGMIEEYEERRFRDSDDKRASFQLEDREGRIRAQLRGNDRIAKAAEAIGSGEPLLVSGKVRGKSGEEDEEAVLYVDNISLLSEAIVAAVGRLRLKVTGDEASRATLDELRALFADNVGASSVELILDVSDDAQVLMSLNGTRVRVTDPLLDRVREMFGGRKNAVEVGWRSDQS